MGRHGDELWMHLGVSPVGAVSVFVSACVLYLVFGLLLQFLRRRINISASTFGIALLTLIGAITARGILGESPTLLGTLIALGTLVVLESVFGRWRSFLPKRGSRRLTRQPVVLMVGDKVQLTELRAHRVNEAHLWSMLRQQGIVNRSQIGLVILEPSGSLTVMRTGAALDPALLHGVKGIDQILGEQDDEEPEPS